ncbi:hypothetical protein PI126_g7945 [Phytophthora idaei]|nr:hypothetical protein PI126_g7945 [Phytophthora idaei]
MVAMLTACMFAHRTDDGAGQGAEDKEVSQRAV